MIAPETFMAVLGSVLLSSLIWGLAFFLVLRLFGHDEVEARVTYFIAVIGHILFIGLAFLCNYVIGRTPGFNYVTFGGLTAPGLLVAVVWLIVLLLIFYAIMLKIAAKTSFVQALGAVALSGFGIFLLVLIAGSAIALAMGYTMGEATAIIIDFFGKLPDMMQAGTAAA